MAANEIKGSTPSPEQRGPEKFVEQYLPSREWRKNIQTASSKGALSEPIKAKRFELPEDMALAIAKASGIGLVPGQSEDNQSRIAAINKQTANDALRIALLN